MQSLSGRRPRGSFKFRETDLRFYQRHFAEVITKQSCLLAIPMSLGKTVSTLTGARMCLRRGLVRRVLVVAPLRVARETWPTEIGLWEHLSDLTWALCSGSPAERRAALALDAEITIINRENLQWLYEEIDGYAGWKWDMVIYDESTRLRGFTVYSKGGSDSGRKWDFTHNDDDFVYLVERFKNKAIGIRDFRKEVQKLRHIPAEERLAVEKRAREINKARLEKKGSLTEFGVLYKAREKMSRVILLSGEPAPSGLLDLGGQTFMIDLGKRLGPTKTHFVNEYFDVSQYDYSVKPKEGAQDRIMSKLTDVMFGLRLEDYIELPPLVFGDRYIDLPKKLLSQYREFERTMYFDEEGIEAVSRGVLKNKLRQIANGSIYKTPEGVENAKRETISLHDEKIAALESIIEESNGQNILIAYCFDFDLARLKKRFPKITVFKETKDFVKKWNEGKIKLACAHPAEMAHGLNLQYGGHIQVWYGLTWSLELYRQFNARLRRPGQPSNVVYIYHILTRGTADEDVLQALHEKGATQDSINEAIRIRLLNPDRVAA